MTVSLCYIYPVVQLKRYYSFALRFAQTYQQFPAGYEHRLTVICNGRQPADVEIGVFKKLEPEFLVHDNTGWDIGAFQRFADMSQADLLICMGANCFFHRPGWMARMVQAVLDHGPGLFGTTAYGGQVLHVRTTCFWLSPELMRAYPAYVGTSRKSRYEFEHGNSSLTRFVLNLGFPCVMVTWDGSFPREKWSDWAPDRNQILVRDQHIN